MGVTTFIGGIPKMLRLLLLILFAAIPFSVGCGGPGATVQPPDKIVDEPYGEDGEPL